jgi:hypothetical protein
MAWLLASVGLLATAPGAWAATCSAEQISARGEPASLKWLALVKARGNWRSKVRGIPSLGAAYANFGRAEDAVERCISDSRSTVCTVTARPCRP